MPDGQGPDGGQMGPGQDQSTDTSSDAAVTPTSDQSGSTLQITQTAATSSVDGSQTDTDGDDSQTTANRDDGVRGGPGMRDYVDSVTSAANLKVILELVLIGLLLIVAAGGAALSQVLRYDPLSILTNRD